MQSGGTLCHLAVKTKANIDNLRYLILEAKADVNMIDNVRGYDIFYINEKIRDHHIHTFFYLT